jgi:hypothetical protein
MSVKAGEGLGAGGVIACDAAAGGANGTGRGAESGAGVRAAATGVGLAPTSRACGGAGTGAFGGTFGRTGGMGGTGISLVTTVLCGTALTGDDVFSADATVGDAGCWGSGALAAGGALGAAGVFGGSGAAARTAAEICAGNAAGVGNCPLFSKGWLVVGRGAAGATGVTLAVLAGRGAVSVARGGATSKLELG